MITKTTKGNVNKLIKVLPSSSQNISSVSFFASKPRKTTIWTVSLNFSSKEEAEDFLEDRNLLKEPQIIASFNKASEESRQSKARPMEELYKK